MSAHFNPENWDSYLDGFRTHFRELNSTDPNRFPRGKYSIELVDLTLTLTLNVETRGLVTGPGRHSRPS